MNEDLVYKILIDVDDNSKLINKVVTELVADYCRPLDDYMLDIQELLNDDQFPISDVELETVILKLPNLLYFTGEAVESLGIKEDIAKGIKQDIYNKIHIETSGTIADKKAKAESDTQEQYLVHSAFQRAYKKIKQRMEAGFEMLNSAKKVLSRRMLEVQLTMESQGGDYNKYNQ